MNAWVFMLRLYRRRLGWLAVAWLFLALTWIAGAALLALSGWFITASALAGLGMLVGLNIFTPSTAIRGVALLRPIGRYLERVIGHEAILRLLTDLRIQLFGQLAHVPARQLRTLHQHERHADLVTRLTQDVDTLDAVPLRVMGPLVAACLTLLAALWATAVWGTPPMAWLLGLGGLGVLTASLGVAALGRQSGLALVAGRAAQRQAVHDHLDGLAELRAYQKHTEHLAKLDQQFRAQTARERRQDMVNSWGEHGVQALLGIWLMGLVELGWQSLEAPVLALLALLALGLGEALGSLPGALWRTGESEAAAQRLMALQAPGNLPASAAQVDSGQPFAHLKGQVLSVNGLLCQRQSGQLQPWSVQLEPGLPLVVYGASGSGKSALLDTLAGELQAQSGRIRLGPLDWLEAPDPSRYAHMAYLGQQDHLLDLTVRDYLLLGLPPTPDTLLHQMLQAVDLDVVLQRTGDGLDYRLGPRGSRVSGGQARRLQLAALLLRDPALVLLDEPFRGLDAPTVQRLLETLGPWLVTRCCVVVSHAPEALPASWPRLRWPASPSG